jgi:hypothetical protein
MPHPQGLTSPCERQSLSPLKRTGRSASLFPERLYFDNTGSGGTLSFGAPACMVISVIETRS